MGLPSTPANYLQERRGINAVATLAIELGMIWRETPLADVGIDGQLELLDEAGRATGKLVAVQVKSGPSWFSHKTPTGWNYYPDAKHIDYWERFPLPVILILHAPDTGETYWTDARQRLRAPSAIGQQAIPVPKENLLSACSRNAVFAHVAAAGGPFISDVNEVLTAMVGLRSSDAGFHMSFFQLFALGLINAGRSVYFGMDLALEIAEANIDIDERTHGVGIGSVEYDFIFDFIEFLVCQALADVNYSDCLVDWYDRALVPSFIAPLTRRGLALVSLISTSEDRLVAATSLPPNAGDRVVQHGSVSVQFFPYGPARVARIRRFEELMRPPEA